MNLYVGYCQPCDLGVCGRDLKRVQASCEFHSLEMRRKLRMIHPVEIVEMAVDDGARKEPVVRIADWGMVK